MLTQAVQKIHELFKEIYGVFGNRCRIYIYLHYSSCRAYDCLDPKDRSFISDYHKFNTKIWMLDRKMAAILTRSIKAPEKPIVLTFQGF